MRWSTRKGAGYWQRAMLLRASNRAPNRSRKSSGAANHGMRSRGRVPATDAYSVNGRTGSFSVARRREHLALNICGSSTTRPLRFPKALLATAFSLPAADSIAASWNRTASSFASLPTWTRRPGSADTAWQSTIPCCPGSTGGRHRGVGWPTAGGSVLRLALMMPDVRTAHPEDDVLGDVRRMIGDAFQIA